MKSERSQINDVLAGDTNIGFGEAFTFAMVLPRLKKIGVKPSQILTSSDKVDVIDTLLNSFGIDIKSTINDGDSNAGIELPAIFISGENGKPQSTHAWFCSDVESYNKEMENPLHTKNYPDLQAVVSLIKAS